MPTTVSAAFNALLADLRFSRSQRDLAQGRIQHLRNFFGDYEVSQPPWAIGSYGRGTVIRWERDVDVMVALSGKAYWKRYRDDSQRFLHSMRDVLNRDYPGTKVSSRRVALRLELSADLQVDLVPVIAVAEAPDQFLFRPLFAKPADLGFRMPDGNRGWQKTNPPYHDALIREADAHLGGHLKPLVRVMKTWNLAHHRRLGSFHLEMIVERLWRGKKAMPPLPEALAETLRLGADLVARPFDDPWRHGGRIDTYLGRDTRAKAVRQMREDAKRSKEALSRARAGDVPSAFERWSVVFGGRFPSYGPPGTTEPA